MKTPSGRATNGTSQPIPLLGELQVGKARALNIFRQIFRSPVALYGSGLALTGIGLATVLALRSDSFGNIWAVLALSLVAAVAEHGRVRLTNALEVSISLLPCLFAAVLFGPLAGLVVGAASFLGHLRRPYGKWIVFTCSRSITWALTGMLVSATEGLAGNRLGAIALGAALGALSAHVLDTCFVAVTYKLRGLGTATSVFRTMAPLAIAAVTLFTPLVALLTLAYQQVSPWTIALFFAPALGAHRIFVLYQEQRQYAEELARVNVRLERGNLSFASTLVATIDEWDRYTAGHSAAVAVYARDIAVRMGLTLEDQQLAHVCGLVHDIGKIKLTPGLVDKPGPLTLSERFEMQEHAAAGARILLNVEGWEEIADVVRHHHERWDGGGYPDGLAANEIPLLSRILAVADSYNAMTSDRPYRDAMASRIARLRLAQAVETQFDTSVVAAFEAVLASSTEEYRTGTRTDFEFGSQDSLLEASAA
jgi:putative nucleotidyltransferase with HDIG domain